MKTIRDEIKELVMALHGGVSKSQLEIEFRESINRRASKGKTSPIKQHMLGLLLALPFPQTVSINALDYELEKIVDEVCKHVDLS